MKLLNSESEITGSEFEISRQERRNERFNHMIRKRGLQDVKRRNRQVIIQTILENDGLSRVEIAQRTELSPSTVSTLVAELIGEGILTESGSHTTTAGRSRTGLTINAGFGAVAVVEIGRKESSMTIFDMALRPLVTSVLAQEYLAGNELFETVVEAIHTSCAGKLPLAGIGLLFQEDMRESDFHVMYSTGIASANITLKEALTSQLRVPVVEEFSQSYTVKQALAERPDPAKRNSAHVSVGSSVVVSVTVEGRAVPLRKDFYKDAVKLLGTPLYTPEPQEKERPWADLPAHACNVIALLCMMFSLNTVFLSGLEEADAVRRLETRLGEILAKDRMPHIQLLRTKQPQHWKGVFAQRIRAEILAAQ